MGLPDPARIRTLALPTRRRTNSSDAEKPSSHHSTAFRRVFLEVDRVCPSKGARIHSIKMCYRDFLMLALNRAQRSSCTRRRRRSNHPSRAPTGKPYISRRAGLFQGRLKGEPREELNLISRVTGALWPPRTWLPSDLSLFILGGELGSAGKRRSSMHVRLQLSCSRQNPQASLDRSSPENLGRLRPLVIGTRSRFPCGLSYVGTAPPP